MDPNIVIQHKGNRSEISKLIQQPLLDMTSDPKLTLCLIEPTITGQDPLVFLISSALESGSIVMQLSLMELMTSSAKLADEATKRWGWHPPQGTLTPSAKRDFGEHIKAEIDKWLAGEDV